MSQVFHSIFRATLRRGQLTNLFYFSKFVVVVSLPVSVFTNHETSHIVLTIISHTMRDIVIGEFAIVVNAKYNPSTEHFLNMGDNQHF